MAMKAAGTRYGDTGQREGVGFPPGRQGLGELLPVWASAFPSVAWAEEPPSISGALSKGTPARNTPRGRLQEGVSPQPGLQAALSSSSLNNCSPRLATVSHRHVHGCAVPLPTPKTGVLSLWGSCLGAVVPDRRRGGAQEPNFRSHGGSRLSQEPVWAPVGRRAGSRLRGAKPVPGCSARSGTRAWCWVALGGEGVTGASPGTPGVGGARRASGISQPLQTVPRGAGSQRAGQWRLGRPGYWGGPGPGGGCPGPCGPQRCGSGASGAWG